jgi:hypothetical protein
VIEIFIKSELQEVIETIRSIVSPEDIEGVLIDHTHMTEPWAWGAWYSWYSGGG